MRMEVLILKCIILHHCIHPRLTVNKNLCDSHGDVNAAQEIQSVMLEYHARCQVGSGNIRGTLCKVYNCLNHGAVHLKIIQNNECKLYLENKKIKWTCHLNRSKIFSTAKEWVNKNLCVHCIYGQACRHDGASSAFCSACCRHGSSAESPSLGLEVLVYYYPLLWGNMTWCIELTAGVFQISSSVWLVTPTTFSASTVILFSLGVQKSSSDSPGKMLVRWLSL